MIDWNGLEGEPGHVHRFSPSNPDSPATAPWGEEAAEAEAEAERRENQLREFIQDQHPEWSLEDVEQEVAAVRREAAARPQKHVTTVKPRGSRADRFPGTP